VADLAKELIDRQSKLEAKRQNLDNWWDRVAQRVSPSDAVFTTEVEPGVSRHERMFDSTAQTASQKFAAIVENLMTPRTQVWNALKPPEELSEDHEVEQYLEELNKLLYAVRYSPQSHFPENKHLCYRSLSIFGNYSLMINDEPAVRGPRYEFLHSRECYWAANHYGTIDTHHRKYRLQGRQALQRAKTWGWTLPTKLSEAMEREPYRDFTFLRVIQPNEQRIPGRADYRGWAYGCCDIALDEKALLKEGGFRTWPLAIGRYTLPPGEVYAHSPAMEAWPAILTLNEEKKTVLRAGQKEVDPPVLLSEEGALEPFNLRSGALNHGMVSDQGTPLAVPFKTGANVPLGLELMEIERRAIGESFLTEIYRVLVEHPDMTATQVLEITHERAVMLAPTMNRLHSEDLGAMIQREIQILVANGRVPEPPQQLAEALDQYTIEYQSPLARAMRASDGAAIIRTMEALPAFVAVDPNVAYHIDVPQSFRELADINGVPARLMRDPKMAAQLAADAAEREEEQQAIEAAPDLSTATLNAAKAASIRQGA
jgi:hypothetical protein